MQRENDLVWGVGWYWRGMVWLLSRWVSLGLKPVKAVSTIGGGWDAQWFK